MKRPGRKTTVSVEQYRRICEWEAARRQLLSLKGLAKELELPMSTVHSVLYKHARKNLEDQLTAENR